MKKDLTGKVAFVIGAGSGMGRQIALRMYKLGVHIVAVDILAENLMRFERDLQAIGGKCLSFNISSIDADALDEAMAKAEKHYGAIDILINAAAISTDGTIETLSLDTINRILDVNIKGMIYATKLVTKYMKKTGGGNIINISSMAAHRGLPTPPDYNGIYTSTKWAMNGFDDCMDKFLLTNYNIHVTTLMPGTTNTERWDKREVVPFPRDKMIPPEYIADVVELILMAPDSVLVKNIRLCAAIEVNNF